MDIVYCTFSISISIHYYPWFYSTVQYSTVQVRASQGNIYDLIRSKSCVLTRVNL